MSNIIKNKVAVVTGASSGIGKSTALCFSSEGYSLVIAARTVETLKETESEIRAEGGKVLSVQTDVSKEEDCKQLILKTIKEFGRIDVLVNNAGISMRAIFNETQLSVIKDVMDVNFWGTVYCTKFALPELLKSQGSIVGVSSIAGFVGLPGRAAYSASKFAMHGFLEALRTENLNNQLHVMIACPGFTSSNIRKSALTGDGESQGESPRTEEKMMTPEEVATAIFAGVAKRKQRIVLTLEGKLAVWLGSRFPKLMQRMVFNKMKKEPNTPLK